MVVTEGKNKDGSTNVRPPPPQLSAPGHRPAAKERRLLWRDLPVFCGEVEEGQRRSVLTGLVDTYVHDLLIHVDV